MDKRSRNILLLFGIFFVVIMIVEATRPQPVNWRPSYSLQDKIPFGSYILHQEIQDILNVAAVETINQSCFTYLIGNDYPAANDKKMTYFFVNDYLYFDDEESEALLDFVYEGHMVFLSARHFSGMLKDTLHIDTYTHFHFEETEATAKLYTTTYSEATTTFKKRFHQSYFTSIDTLKSRALGYFSPSEKSSTATLDKEFKPEVELNFIKVPHGKGYFYLHTLPEAFSNYFLLNGNANYASQVLSHIETDLLLWDEYKKSGRRFVETPMRFVLSETSLEWAYYLSIIGLVLFVVYKGKREQRVIPVREPLRNTTVDFTKTIGDLYFQHRDYSNLIAKKITYFLERIRSQFYLNTTTLDESFAEKLAQKKGKTKEDVYTLVRLLQQLKDKNHHTEEDLISLNREIEKFER